MKKTKILVKLWQTLTYARFFVVLASIAAQVTFAVFYIFLFNEQQEVYWGINFALSLAFVIYLLSTNTKNEFKIAWMIPVLAVPFVGISLYLMYIINLGRISTKKRLMTIKEPIRESLLRSEKILDSVDTSNLAGLDVYLRQSEGCIPYNAGECTYYHCGEAMLEQYLADLRSARKSIFFEYFIVAPGEFWHQVLEVLKERAAAGVEVRVLYDGWGSISFARPQYERYLAGFGIQAKTILPFIPFFDVSLNNRDHRKITVIDNTICYTGGLNIADEYVNIGHQKFEYWKDAAIRMTGPAVITFNALFLELWHLAHHSSPQNDCQRFITDVAESYAGKHSDSATKPIVLPYGDDAFNTDDLAEDVYIHMLTQSRTYTHFMSPYAIFDNHLLNTLIMTAKRGVQVQIIVPMPYDHYITWCVGRVVLKKLIQNGVQVFCYQKGFIHSKVCISDGNLATVGTINLDYRSLSTHFECGVLLSQVPEIADMERDFQETLQFCQEYTLETYKKIPLLRRFLGHLLLPLAPIF